LTLPAIPEQTISMARYRQYYDEEEGEDLDFTVFIIHGRSPELRKVERFIK
jgi:hypothetical protein